MISQEYFLSNSRLGMFSNFDLDLYEQMNTAPGGPGGYSSSSAAQQAERLQLSGVSNEEQQLMKTSTAKPVTNKSSGLLLPSGFQPRPQDVICGRGLKTKNHPGNREFKLSISLFTEAYSKARTKFDKTSIVTSVLEAVRERGGIFVKELSNGEWAEVGEDLKRDKIGQAFRDTLHSQYKSSTRAKRRRWKKEEQERALAGQQQKGNKATKTTTAAGPAEQIQQLENAVLTNNAVVQHTQQLSMNLDELGGALAPEASVDRLFHATNRMLLDTIQSNPQFKQVSENQADQPIVSKFNRYPDSR